MLSLTSRRTLKQRGQNSRGCLHAGVDIGMTMWIICRHATTRTCLQSRHSRFCIHHRCICTSTLPWASTSIATNRCVNEAGIDVFQHVVPKTKFVHHATTKVLHQHIAMLHHFFHKFDCFWMFEIHRDVLFPHVLLRKIRRHGSHAWKCKTCEVAFGGFKLDDVCTQVREHAGAMRP